MNGPRIGPTTKTADVHGGLAPRRAGVPLERAACAVVAIHGRGGTATDILALAAAVATQDTAMIAPRAVGNTWYPHSFLAPFDANEPSLSSALASVSRVVDTIADAGLSLSRVVLLGFSQGACLASEWAARHPGRWGGLVAFTGGLIGPPGTAWPVDERDRAMATATVFLGSGDPDPHVPWARVAETAALFTRQGAEVDLRRYSGMPHTVVEDQLVAARDLVERVAQ